MLPGVESTSSYPMLPSAGLGITSPMFVNTSPASVVSFDISSTTISAWTAYDSISTVVMLNLGITWSFVLVV